MVDAVRVKVEAAEVEPEVADEEQVRDEGRGEVRAADGAPVVAEARGRAASASAPAAATPSRTNPVHPVSR